MSGSNSIVDASERIQLDKCKIEKKELEKVEVGSFNLCNFWNQFSVAVQSLSNQVTKVSFVCGKEPFPTRDEVRGMLVDMMQSYSVMRDLYSGLPEAVGATVHRSVTGAVLSILAALLAVVNSLTDLTDKGAKERLILTSTFWEACNSVESLPRDNLSASTRVLGEELALAEDAYEELTTEPVHSTEFEVHPSLKLKSFCLQRKHRKISKKCSTMPGSTPFVDIYSLQSTMFHRPGILDLSMSSSLVQTIDMVLPPRTILLPQSIVKHNKSRSLANILQNISRTNPSINATMWNIYKEWKDVFQNVNVTLGVDEESLNAIKELNYKVLVSSSPNYYAYFRRPRGEPGKILEWLPPEQDLDFEKTCSRFKKHRRGPPSCNGRIPYYRNFSRYPY